jgi:hypothetical protein
MMNYGQQKMQAHTTALAFSGMLKLGSQLGAAFLKELTLVMLAFFSDIERSHRSMIAHYSGPHFTGLTLLVGQNNLIAIEVGLVG